MVHHLREVVPYYSDPRDCHAPYKNITVVSARFCARASGRQIWAKVGSRGTTMSMSNGDAGDGSAEGLPLPWATMKLVHT
jgi:hypothetical protein